MHVPLSIRSCAASAALFFCAPVLAQSLPTAPCSFLSDSGGSTADSGTSISFTFDGHGGLSFSGSGSVQVQDTGTYHEELVTTVSDSATPFATYCKTGKHRNNVKAWHEYEYYWNAYKVTEPLSITEK